mgnify:CR=1 FL=1
MTGFRPGVASALTVAVPFRIFPGFPILSEAFLPVYGALRRLFLIGFYSAAPGLSRRQSVCRTAASEAEILHAFLLAHAESVAEVPDGVGGVVVGNVRAQRVHLFVPAFLAAAPVRTLPRDLRREQRAEFVDLLRDVLVVSVSSAYRVRSRSLKSSMPKSQRIVGAICAVCSEPMRSKKQLLLVWNAQSRS